MHYSSSEWDGDRQRKADFHGFFSARLYTPVLESVPWNWIKKQTNKLNFLNRVIHG